MRLASKIGTSFKNKCLRIKKGKEIWVEKYQRYQTNQSNHDIVYEFSLESSSSDSIPFKKWKTVFDDVIEEIDIMLNQFKDTYKELYFEDCFCTLSEHRKKVANWQALGLL